MQVRTDLAQLNYHIYSDYSASSCFDLEHIETHATLVERNISVSFFYATDLMYVCVCARSQDFPPSTLPTKERAAQASDLLYQATKCVASSYIYLFLSWQYSNTQTSN